jgi:glycosyltransferase involved in cell wall biosynthesis
LKEPSIEELRDELERTRAELRAARDRIAVMELSRFWKLRNAWWSLKGLFRGRGAGGGPALREPEIVWRNPSRELPADRDATGGRFSGKSVLFVLPVAERGGGANVVFREAAAMRAAGVDARVVNVRPFEGPFRSAYPDPPVPVAFASPGEIPALGRGFDAVVATANRSVEWLLPLAGHDGGPVLGYYVQDFEPYFYDERSAGWAHAFASYTLVPGLVRFAKTEWTAHEVTSRCGVPCAVVGPSLDTTLFRAQEGRRASAPPVHVTAMIRPSSPRRQPDLTLRVFGKVHERFGARVAFTLFGIDAADPAFRGLPTDFPHRMLGIVSDRQLADLFAEAHVFADFSSYQAMGLTAMEAMACGAAAIVPKAGGAAAFAEDGRNALVVDTSRFDACDEALVRLVEDPGLASRLGAEGQRDMAAFPPEKAAARVLECLFEEGTAPHSPSA